MKSTRDQIATLQAKQPKQECSAVDRRNTATNHKDLSGSIPAGNNVKATVAKALKGK